MHNPPGGVRLAADREKPVVSRNLKGSTELTLLIPIKPGLVSIPRPITYRERLRLLLDALFELRKQGVEGQGAGFVGPLEMLRTIHFVHWFIVDESAPEVGVGTTRSKLVLVVTFDQPWEPYIRSIAEDAGPLLDLIFSHCEGAEGMSSLHGYQKFAEFVRDSQIECTYFAAASPELSVDDVRFLEQLQHRTTQLASGRQAPALPVDAPVPPLVPRDVRRDDVNRLSRLLAELYRIRAFYPADAQRGEFSDRAFYDRAATLLLRGFLPVDGHPSPLLLTLLHGLDATYRGAGAWYSGLLKPVPRQAVEPAPIPQSVLDEVQGGILESHGSLTHGCLVLLQIKDDEAEKERAKIFLRSLASSVRHGSASPVKCNVAFSHGGLQKLLRNRAPLDAAPLEFRVGMEERAGLIGDLGANHPSSWNRPRVNMTRSLPENSVVPLDTVDVLILVQGTPKDLDPPKDDHLWSERHPFHGWVADIENGGHGVRVLHVQPLRRYPHRFVEGGRYREHFGFVDGISQPELVSGAPNGALRRHQAALGDFILGHPDSRGEELADTSPLFKNGSFLVVRKLAQDVHGLDTFVNETARARGIDGDRIRSQMMGRTPNGAPLALGGAGKDGDNDFDYSPKTGGDACPLQAHIRRANPRFSPAFSVHGKPKSPPRILRRGFSYGPPPSDTPDDAERGLLFMAYNARIAEQFEVLQRWLNGGNVTGLHSELNDPITGPVESNKTRRVSIDGIPAVLPDQPFVKVEWGGYYFVPSRTGLEILTAAAQPPLEADEDEDEDELVAEGQHWIEELLALSKPPLNNNELALREWKKILEDDHYKAKARSIWAAIVKRHRGVLRTPYGVLVGSAKLAHRVLTEERSYSVREYWARMQQSFGALHLGMDRHVVRRTVCPHRSDEAYVKAASQSQIDYDRNAIANAEIAKVSRSEAFVRAHALGLAVFEAARAQREAPIVDLVVLAERVISELSACWFGFPDKRWVPGVALTEQENQVSQLLISGNAPELDDRHAYCPADFTIASQHIFRPNPDDWAVAASHQRGMAIRKATKAYLAGSVSHPFIDVLRANFKNDADSVERALIGAVDGFVAATFGSFVSVADHWLEEGELWRLQQHFHDELAGLSSVARAAAEAKPGAEAGTHSPCTSLQIEEIQEKKIANFIQDGGPLLSRIVKALELGPVPPWVHRTALEDGKLGDKRVNKGERVVINLASAAVDGGMAMLFGGVYHRDKPHGFPVHACPGREIALGAISGLLGAVLLQEDVRREGRFIISFGPRPAGSNA